MKPEQVRLFIKPLCGWCDEAIDWLDQRGIKYETLDVIADPAARKQMFQLSGQTLAPVIQVDGEVLADFGVEELEEYTVRSRYRVVSRSPRTVVDLHH